ncbi:AfsR/SARP family transcriptional regulator [Streptomyces sp. NPDC001795]|uniref:AfsR/SARP family transcriptional regulator n=1 Tax=Streptomyces sp. NPDC001795 TaxID=3154525 RepID=UPI00332F0031
MLEFRVLGALQVLRDGAQVELGPEMWRRLLAILLVKAGQPVAVDTLIDELWRGDHPRSARKSVQIYVHRLRRALGSHEPIRYAGNHYSIHVTRAELDATRFTDLISEARARQHRGDLVGASDLYQVGLNLWRGAAYGEVADIPSAAMEAQRLDEWRLMAWEDRCDTDLALGRREGVIGELLQLANVHPFRERLRALLMLALYQSERQAEALKVYRDTRTLFIDELGIEPGARLQALNAWILERGSEPSRAVVPSSPLEFTGRAGELSRLSARLGYDDTAWAARGRPPR